jgi:hypothetical protein
MRSKHKQYLASILDVYIFPNSIILLGVFLYERIYGIDLMLIYFDYVFACLWAIILTKDIFKGSSISKKLLGLQVVDTNNKQYAPPHITILRNAIGFILFPIEVLAYLFAEKRLGDRIFSTEVIDVKPISLKDLFAGFSPPDLLIWLKYWAVSFVGVMVIGSAVVNIFMCIIGET